MKVEIDFDSVTASAEMQKAFEETFSGEVSYTVLSSCIFNGLTFLLPPHEDRRCTWFAK